MTTRFPGRTVRAFLIYNLEARRGSAARLRRILRFLLDEGISARPCAIQDLRQGAGPVAREDLVVVYGGDGTVHHLLPRLLQWRRPVAVLPGGTANCLAAELGVPSREREAVRAIHKADVVRAVVPRGDRRRFILMAGCGVDAWLLGRIGSGVKKWLGVAGFWLVGAFHFLRCPLHPWTVRASGESWRGTLVVVANAQRYGRDLRIAPSARLDEPLLDLCVFTAERRRRFPVYLWAVLRGRHRSLPDVVYRKAEAVELCAPAGGAVQMDGELLDFVPRRIEVTDERIVFLGCDVPARAPRSPERRAYRGSRP
ncbi:MAG: hypothetical protein Kow00109_19380 [Acidobacteriota bacterium]